jgi:NADPH:quinone reductase
METALDENATHHSRHGSPFHKQVYIYGALGHGPLEINRNNGVAWGVSG